MTQAENLNRVMEEYGNSIYRMSFLLLKNEQDAQDILQETLIKYLQKAPNFKTQEHEKAWLLRVANNLCKDMLRFRKRNHYIDLEEISELCAATEEKPKQLLQQVLMLAENYRKVIYLFYYEGYSVEEVAAILNLSQSAVKKRLERGRNYLRIILEEDM